jgi:hypothetical protein
MSYEHGVSARQVATSVSTPVVAGCGIPFVVGTAPVHITSGKVNEAVLAYNYAEAAAALGYSDDWGSFTLCEVMYSHFRLYGMGPVVFVNVLDPATHKEAVAAADINIVEGQVKLPAEAIDSAALVIKPTSAGTAMVKDTDYVTFRDDAGKLVIERKSTSTVWTTGLTTLNVAYNKVKPSLVTKTEIIGGFNTETKKSSGFELIDSVFPKFGIVPDLLLAPAFSHESEVAAIMAAKAENINSIFEGKALIDADSSTVTYYTDVNAWKSSNNINSKFQLLCWPKVKLGDKVFHLSTHLAGIMAKTDSNNGDCPSESASNKGLQIDSAVTVTEGGTITEVNLDPTQATSLNAQGIITALNFIGGFVLWGNESACFPANTDVKDYFYCISRTFGWVSNSLILTYWSKLDGKLNRRLIDNIVDSVNIWLNGLSSEEKILGGRIEFREEDNSLTNLMSGKAVFHIFLTPPSPAKELEFVLEYDADYVTAALAA